MGQVLHGSATTTETVRRVIQNSQESIRALARWHGVNPKTIAKWKKRTGVADGTIGPKQAHSTVLSTEEEALIVAFRKHTLLSLDDYICQQWQEQPQRFISDPHHHTLGLYTCIVPEYSGIVSLSTEQKEQLWDSYFTVARRASTDWTVPS